MSKTIKIAVLILAAIFLPWMSSPADAASKYDAVLSRWSKKETRRDDMGGTFTIQATLYTAEYVEALMQSEAEKNLWTAYELEDYKYNFLKGLNMEENIAVHLEIEELGPTAHMAPFNEMVSLWIGGTKYSPTDYDPRFNMPLQGKRDGMVFFPRFSEKTGKPLIDRSMSLRFVIKGSVSPVINASELRFTWDVQAQDTAGIVVGSAADRLEVDRLIRRLERLTAERDNLESELEAKKKEIAEVNTRIEELQSK